jgi:hypothetical protein
MSENEKEIESDDDESTKGKYTTRYGSHLTQTTEGVSDTDADIKKEAK